MLRFLFDMQIKAQKRTLKRPMAVARRVSLVGREITERLSSAGVEMVLAHASRLSEGQMLADNRYYGSTMLTLDMQALQDVVRDSCDAATAVRLVRLLEENPAVKRGVALIAQQEASRLACQPMRPHGIDLRVRAEGSSLFIDVDVEASVLHKTRQAAG